MSAHRPLIALALLSTFADITHARSSGRGEFGLIMARGNTSSETANIKLSFSRERQDWRHHFSARLLYGRSNDIESARRWETAWQSEVKLNGHPFLFGAMRYEHDLFGGFAHQSTASTGLGYQFIDTDTLQLSASLGAGYRQLRPQRLVRDAAGEVIDRIEDATTEDAVGKAGLNYQQQLTETTQLSTSFFIESGTRNTLAQNDLSLQVAMTEKLALGLGYTVRHNAQPPEGLKQTDQLTTLNLVYLVK